MVKKVLRPNPVTVLQSFKEGKRYLSKGLLLITMSFSDSILNHSMFIRRDRTDLIVTTKCSMQLEHRKAGSHHVARANLEIPSSCHCFVVRDMSHVQSAKAVIHLLN